MRQFTGNFFPLSVSYRFIPCTASSRSDSIHFPWGNGHNRSLGSILLFLSHQNIFYKPHIFWKLWNWTCILFKNLGKIILGTSLCLSLTPDLKRCSICSRIRVHGRWDEMNDNSSATVYTQQCQWYVVWTHVHHTQLLPNLWRQAGNCK